MLGVLPGRRSLIETWNVTGPSARSRGQRAGTGGAADPVRRGKGLGARGPGRWYHFVLDPAALVVRPFRVVPALLLGEYDPIGDLSDPDLVPRPDLPVLAPLAQHDCLDGGGGSRPGSRAWTYWNMVVCFPTQDGPLVIDLALELVDLDDRASLAERSRTRRPSTVLAGGRQPGGSGRNRGRLAGRSASNSTSRLGRLAPGNRRDPGVGCGNCESLSLYNVLRSYAVAFCWRTCGTPRMGVL